MILFIDSFLLDPLLLIGFGILWVGISVRLIYPKSSYRGWIGLFSLLTLIFFWSVSISLFYNLSWVNWMIWFCQHIPPFRPPKNGLDWMINSGVLTLINPDKVKSVNDLSTGAKFLSWVLFLLYPLWLYLGVTLGHILFGRTEKHTGLIGALKQSE